MWHGTTVILYKVRSWPSLHYRYVYGLRHQKLEHSYTICPLLWLLSCRQLLNDTRYLFHLVSYRLHHADAVALSWASPAICRCQRLVLRLQYKESQLFTHLCVR